MKNFGGDFGGGFGKGPFGDYNGNGRYDPQDHWLNENYAGTDDEFDASDRNITGKGRRSHGKGRPSAYSPAAVIIAAGSCICMAGVFLAASACVSVYVFLETLAWSMVSAALSTLFFYAGESKKRRLQTVSAIFFAVSLTLFMIMSSRMNGCYFGDPDKAFPGVFYPLLAAAGLIVTGFLVQKHLHGSPLSLKKFFIASAICTAAAVAAVPLNVSIEYRGITNRDKCSEKVIEILRDNDIYADSSSVKTEADDPDPGRFSPFYSVLISVDDSSSWPDGADPAEICHRVNELKTEKMGVFTIIDFQNIMYDENGRI